MQVRVDIHIIGNAGGLLFINIRKVGGGGNKGVKRGRGNSKRKHERFKDYILIVYNKFY